MSSFSLALTSLKLGDKISRRGWNGKNLHLNMVEDSRCCNAGWIGFYKDDILICPWTPSQSDLLTDDWDTAE